MLELRAEERALLRTLHGRKDKKFTDARLNDPKLREGFISVIRNLLLAEALGLSKGADGYAEKLKEAASANTPENAFAESMAIALVSGYFQALGNDIASTETPEFGFKQLGRTFKSCVAMYLEESVDSESTTKSLETGLNVTIRECSGEEYFANGYWHSDILVLNNLLTADIDDGYNKKMLEGLRNNDDISGMINRYMPDIKEVYKLLFADSFGIEQYKGVLTDDGDFLTIEEGANSASVVKEGPATLTNFARRVYAKINGKVTISSARQFDYDEIFSKDQIVYFPKKILEYALGRESTLNIRRNTYENSAYSISWESYSEKYVYKNIDAILYRGVYKALERVLRGIKVISTDFTDSEFTQSVDNYGEFIIESLKREGVADKVRSLMGKLVRSVKSAYILSKYPYLAGNIAAINFRVCMEPTIGGLGADVSSSEYLFHNLVAENSNEIFSAPVDISAGRQSAIGVAISSRIYEYQYDINPMLTKAEPLFGYTVQRLNQKKGLSAGWDNILIGQSLSGKELYASATSDMPMQKAFTHNIIAGSRSGKGVMTMNILANALAANKPIFYLDRKPDMASMLYQLSNGQQFIVNGGLYQGKFDNFKCFSEETGDALKMWRENGRSYLESNPKIAELFGSQGQGYYSVIGDYCYFRAFMFCLGICVLRTKLAGVRDDIRNDVFGGNNGIVIVVDELTGFQSSISRLFSTISARMVQAALKLGNPDAVIEARNKIEDEIRVQELKIGEATKDSARMTAESKIRELTAKLNSLVDEQGVYASTLFKKICDSYGALLDNKVAGFVNKEFDYSDIFVLGQILSAGYFATSLTAPNPGSVSQVFFPLTSTKNDYYAAYKGADIIRSFIEELGQEDWFLGRNPGYDYAKKSLDPAAYQCLDIDGNWEYVGLHTCNEIRLVDDASFARPVLFKPYLVLNTHFECNPPLSGDGDYQYVQQCAKRVNDSAGGINLWDTVRLKHIPPEIRSQITETEKMYGSLDEGIGFKGLVRDTLLTTKEGKNVADDIDAYVTSVLKKSGDIADYVAQAMGYPNWQALIFDLSPAGLFSFDDMVNAVMYPEKYTMETRLPLYAKLGLLGSSAGGEEGDTEAEQAFGHNFDDLFANVPVSDEASATPAGGFDTPVAPQPVPESTTPTMDDAAKMFWGDDEVETPVDPDAFSYSDGVGFDEQDGDDLEFPDEDDFSEPAPAPMPQPVYTPIPPVEQALDLMSIARVLVSMVIGVDRSGYSYSDDEVFELEQFACEMLKEVLAEGG